MYNDYCIIYNIGDMASFDPSIVNFSKHEK